MNVVFGWHLDGPTHPETVSADLASMGSAVIGPLGFIDLLETRLGLSGPATTPAFRIAQYLARLKVVDDGAQFFSSSLSVDAWATARLVLSWRDALKQAGWDGSPIVTPGNRLSALADIEAVTGTALAPGLGDRLLAVMTALKSEGTSVLEQVRLVTPSAALPPLWRRLFERLAELGTVIADAQHKDEDCRAQISIVEADDEGVAAELVAAWLAAGSERNSEAVIIRPVGAALLDEACHRFGLPRVGGGSRSRWRAAMQVLPLALEACWSPLDPFRMLEFLTLQQSPIPPTAANCFLEALEQAPGVGGPAWQKAWENATQRRRERLAARGLTDTDLDKKLKRDLVSWRAWLEPQRFDPRAGMPTANALDVCRRVQQWAIQRATATGDVLFEIAAAEAGALADAVTLSPGGPLPKVQLNRMLDTVVAEGVSLPGGGAEAAPWTIVEGPGQLWGHTQTAIWWAFIDQGIHVAKPPWTDEEFTALQVAGCTPERMGDALLREARAWRNPLHFTTEDLVLVLPRTMAGETVAPHPLLHEIKASKQLRVTTIDATQLLREEKITFAGRTFSTTPIPAATPPEPRRGWKAAPGTIPPRPEESATSLELLLGCSFAWTMKHHARLRPGAARQIPEGDRLIGNLAHAIVARLFAQQPSWEPEKALIRAQQLFDEMLQTEAAPLLLPGQSVERTGARDGISQAVKRLVQLIHGAGLKVSGCEIKKAEVLGGSTQVRGIIDLLLESRTSQQIVVDLKWSRNDRYRREEIAEGRPVQLATYSHLVPRIAGKVAPAGYFMLRQRRLLSAAQEVFPPDTHIAGSDLAMVWDNIVASWQCQMQELASGVIVATGVEADVQQPSGNVPPLVLEPPCRFCDYSRLCGATVK